MVTKVLNSLKRNNINKGSKILVALSGGADSSVLLDVLAKLSDELSLTLSAAHLNHMLRADEADDDERFAREKCAFYGIGFISERIDVAKAAGERGESDELAARNIRYDFLERARKSFGADFIATAHNANDNLETIIYNLARGSGISGLAGIPPMREKIIRPLLECSRAEIEEYAKKFGISYCVDRTNSELVYSRNRVRHTVVAPLLEINPSAVENASRASAILRNEAEFIDRMARCRAEEIKKGAASCDAADLVAEPALISRISEIFSAEALGEERISLQACHVESIASLASNGSASGRINLPSGLVVRRVYEKIVFEKDELRPSPEKVLLKEGESRWGEYTIHVKKLEKNGKIHNLLNTFFVPYDKIQNGLFVRARAEGDEIKLPKRKTKTLKRLFIDEKLPRDERDFTPVIADCEKVFGVMGFGADERFYEKEKPGYLIEIKK